MATVTWTASLPGYWDSAGNWSAGAVPGPNDTVAVAGSAPALVVLAGSATVAAVDLTDPAAAIDLAGNLTVTGALGLGAGMMDVTGSLDATDLTNTGSIIDNGFVVLRGPVDTASLERIGGTGVLEVLGPVNNAGATLDSARLSPDIASWGTVQGGVASGAIANATLDAVALAGTVTLAGDMAFSNDTNYGDALVGSGESAPTLTFLTDETLDAVTASGLSGIVAATTLTIGSAAHIQAATGDTRFQGATIANFGTVSATAAGGLLGSPSNLTTVAVSDAAFSNAGVIQALDRTAPVAGTPGLIAHATTGSALVRIAAGRFDNLAGGTIEAGQAAGSAAVTIAAITAFTNDGVVRTWDPTASAGGTIDIAAFVDGSGTLLIGGGGTLELETAVSQSQTIVFDGPGNLILDLPQFVAAAIEGFGAGDTLTLGGATVVAGGSANGGLDLVTAAGTGLDLNINGQLLSNAFVATQAGGATSILMASAPVLCFAAGTRIDTDRGPVPVESLRPGDRVGTARGTIRPIEWIGHRHVNCRRHPDPARVCPVRIARHAFGSGRPTRALLLSPDHAVFVDDVLVPVRLLVNGTTIAPRKVAKIDYYHIELKRHDILLAEGLPVESYLETGGRACFANGGNVLRLYPDFAPDPARVAEIWEARGCAPLVLSDKRIAPIRAMLSARAEALRGDHRRKRL